MNKNHIYLKLSLFLVIIIVVCILSTSDTSNIYYSDNRSVESVQQEESLAYTKYVSVYTMKDIVEFIILDIDTNIDDDTLYKKIDISADEANNIVYVSLYSEKLEKSYSGSELIEVMKYLCSSIEDNVKFYYTFDITLYIKFYSSYKDDELMIEVTRDEILYSIFETLPRE